jgi:oligopeptide/dipeptide ABC transporter ATP-binding protein
MYAGQLMERGEVDQIIESPLHPYTQGLLRCQPRIGVRQEKIQPIRGLVPDLANLPPGCPFAPRCDKATSECSSIGSIPLKEVSDGRLVRCLLY